MNKSIATDCAGLSLSQISTPFSEVASYASKVDCNLTRQIYHCDKLELDLDEIGKKKIIQCDKKSIESNNFSDANLFSCVWNGLTISGEQLVDLAKLPMTIATLAKKGFIETQECNKDVEKKRLLLNAYNSTITDKRFKVEENFFGKNFQDMPCSEIEKLLSSRMENYRQYIDRELRASKLNGKDYKIPEELLVKNSEILINLDEAFKEAGVVYNCYTPKVKAEFVCAAVTSLLGDIALGAGLLKAVNALKIMGRSNRLITKIRPSSIKTKSPPKTTVGKVNPPAIDELHPKYINPKLQAVQKELSGDYLSFEALDKTGKKFAVPARIMERLSDGSHEYAYKISYVEPETGMVKTVKLSIESIAQLNAKAGDATIENLFEAAAKKDSHFKESIDDFKHAEKEAEVQAKLKMLADEEKKKIVQSYVSTEGMEVTEISFSEFEAAQKGTNSKKIVNKAKAGELEFSLDSKDEELARNAKEAIRKKLEKDNAKLRAQDLKKAQPTSPEN